MSGVPERRRTRWGGAFHPINLLALATLALAPGRAPLAGQAPDEAWRTITTEHFRINFPEELEPLGRRAAERAEWAYGVLEEALIEPPGGMIDVVVTDHTDSSNGFAQIFPSNRITVYARPPVDGLSLGYFDEWMELVILHELAHIVHLDEVRNPIGRLGRAVFGRVSSDWPFFPEAATPGWVTEGLATWYESRLTDAGRIRGTFQEMEIRTAVLEGRFEDIGQASGSSPLWPAGARPYTYGARFFEHMLDRYGEDKMARFVEAVAGQWIPYRLDAAGRDAFGVSLSSGWREWTDELRAELADLDDRLGAAGPVTEPERLTTDARWGLHPQVSPDGTRLVYTRSDGRSDIQLTADAPGGGAGHELARTNGLGTFSWLPDGGLLLSQMELDGPYRAYGDLYLVEGDGSTRRITRQARLSDPSAAPDGSWAAAVRQGGGTNALVRVELPSGAVRTLVAPDPDVHWAFPRVSPDGRWIAVSRWEPDGYTDVVVLEAASGRQAERITRDRAIDLAPAWAPDGRFLVWSSDRTGIPNVLGAPIDPGTGRAGEVVMLTNVRTGATFPSVDPDGAWLYFSGYHVDGWDVERVPFRPAGAPPAPAPAPRFAPPETTRARPASTAPVSEYAPGPTLRPTYWEISTADPVVFPARLTTEGLLRRREALGYAVGAQTSGRDLVGRHSYSLYGRVHTQRPKVDAGFGYTYGGFGTPLLSFTATQRYDDAGQLTTGTAPALDTLFVLQAERSLQGALTFLAPTWRHNLAFTVSGGLTWESRELLDRDLDPTRRFQLNRPTSRLAEVGASVSFVTGREHSFQMGTTRGGSLFVQGRLLNELALPDSLRSVEDRDRSLGDVVGRVRVSIPLWSTGRVTHVLALQGTGGVAEGPGAGPGHFDVGGASGRPESVTGAELFGGSFLFFPVRGYPTSTRFGRYAWTASAEYRFPLLMLNRGLGAWPLHFDRVVGSLFFDAGNAWGPDLSSTGFANPLRSALASVGAEITTEVLALYDVTTRLRTGVALPLVEGDGATVYVRVGLPF